MSSKAKKLMLFLWFYGKYIYPKIRNYHPIHD